jgi:hypothetical protein
VARLLFEGGAGEDGLVNTPKLLPQLPFLPGLLDSCSSHCYAGATSALAVAVAATAAVAAVGSAACVATAELTTAIIAVAETAAAASHLVVAAAGAWPGLGQSLHFSSQAAIIRLLRSFLCALTRCLPLPLARGLLSGRSTNSGIDTSGMMVEGQHDKWRCSMPPRVS